MGQVIQIDEARSLGRFLGSEGSPRDIRGRENGRERWNQSSPRLLSRTISDAAATVKIVVMGDATPTCSPMGLKMRTLRSRRRSQTSHRVPASSAMMHDVIASDHKLRARSLLTRDPKLSSCDRQQRSSDDARKGAATAATERRAEGERAGPVGYSGEPAGAAGPRTAVLRDSRTASPNDA